MFGIISSVLYLIFNVVIFDWVFLFSSNSVINKFFYKQIKHILSKHSNPKYKLIHSINMLLYSIYVIRFLSVVISLEILKSFTDQDYDFFAKFFNQFSNGKDHFYVVTFVMLFIFILLLEPLMYFTTINTITWQKYHDLNIVNFELYQRYSENRFEENSNKVSIQLKILNSLTLKSAEINKALFNFSKLENFPTLSDELRIIFIKATIIMNLVCKIIITIGCKYIFVYFE